MEKKKFSPLSVALITFIITSMLFATIWFFGTKDGSNHTMAVGETITETVQVAEDTECIATFVYLGASSKLYQTEDSESSVGIFLDIFEEDGLAELIDSAGFPYKQEYVAVTSSTDPVRYMIKTVSGETFWVEP